MASIPLPALDLKNPQQPSPLDDVSKLMALRSMMTNQQSQQQELQIRQQQVKDQQATTAAMKNWDGKDYGTLAKSVLDNGGSATAAQGVQQHGLTVQKTVSDIAAQDAATGSKNLETFIGRHKAIGDALEGIESVPDDQLHAKAVQTVSDLVQKGILDQPTGQQLLQGVQAIQDPKALRAQIDVFAKSSMGAKAVADQAKTEAETAASNAKAGLDKAQTFLAQNKADIIDNYKKNPNALLAQVDAIAPPNGPNAALNARTKSQLHFALSNGDVDGAKEILQKAGEQVGAVEKDIQVARATQPLKIETAEAEGKAQQLMRGLAEPVYAMDAQGNKVLTSKTAALQSGSKVILPVTEKEVTDDTMLNNRLADVHQKIARYEQAMQDDIPAKDRGNIAALIGSDRLKIGAFGTELPTDRLNAAMDAENIKQLSPQARDAVIAYYNARESLVGYNRVLSGSGRSNEQALQLQMQTLPNPAISDKDYTARSINQFKENLRIVGQGLPKIPGVKSPDEWEQDIKKPNSGAGSGVSFKAPNGKTYNFPDQASLDNFKKEARIQ